MPRTSRQLLPRKANPTATYRAKAIVNRRETSDFTDQTIVTIALPSDPENLDSELTPQLSIKYAAPYEQTPHKLIDAHIERLYPAKEQYWTIITTDHEWDEDSSSLSYTVHVYDLLSKTP